LSLICSKVNPEFGDIVCQGAKATFQSVNFSDGTIWSPARYRWCYARGDRLNTASNDEAILSRLIDVMKPPGQPAQLHALDVEQKRCVVAEQIAHLRTASASKFRDINAAEVFAAHLHAATLPGNTRAEIFGRVNVESLLLPPVSAWLRAKELDVLSEVPLGANKADVVGYRNKTFWVEEKLVAIELKNTLDELDRGFAQLSTYCDYAHEVYLACTPDLAAQFLWRHARAPNVMRWEPKLLDARLKALGCGLLLVEGAEVVAVLNGKTREPKKGPAGEARSAIARLTDAQPDA